MDFIYELVTKRFRSCNVWCFSYSSCPDEFGCLFFFTFLKVATQKKVIFSFHLRKKKKDFFAEVEKLSSEILADIKNGRFPT